MKYTKNDHTVIIERGIFHTILTVINPKLEVIYTNRFLPLCNSRIEAEENAERIANQYTN